MIRICILVNYLIGCFTCRYYSQKEGYTGMKLICSLFITFLKIGAFTFGGGYAMIALLENEFVEKKKWLEKSEFLDMVAVAESTPGPVAVNSATYIGYKIAGFAGATMSTLAVCIPSFFVIYVISLFFDQFLSLRWVSCAFRGIQVCVIYLILTAGLKMLKSIDKNTLNLTLLTLVMASMLCCSITAVSFSSVFYILICGAVGLVVFFLRKSGKEMGKRHDISASLSELLMIGALSFGGGYGMVSLVRERVLSNGWLTENEFLNFIAVSESTPGPLAVNMATFIGSTQGGILGSFVATLGVVLPSFLIILLIASALKNLMKYAPVNAFLSGVRPCVVAMILATALSMALSTLFGLTDLQAGFAPDLRSIAVFAMLGATHLICKIIRKTAPSPILMILFSAGLGILFW